MRNHKTWIAYSKEMEEPPKRPRGYKARMAQAKAIKELPKGAIELIIAHSKEQEDPRKNPKKLKECLDMLLEGKKSTKEKNLSVLVDTFTYSLQHTFVKENYITLLYVCINSIKKGSEKVICLACRVIGLLAITAGNLDDLANEVLKESISPLSQALQSGLGPAAISSLLDCLAIVTSVYKWDFNVRLLTHKNFARLVLCSQINLPRDEEKRIVIFFIRQLRTMRNHKTWIAYSKEMEEPPKRPRGHKGRMAQAKAIKELPKGAIELIMGVHPMNSRTMRNHKTWIAYSKEMEEPPKRPRGHKARMAQAKAIKELPKGAIELIIAHSKEQEDPRKNPKKLKECLDMLLEGKKSTREKNLSVLVDTFTYSLQHTFVKENYITLLYVCINSIKKGSEKVICLACRVIGLLAITAGNLDDLANEVLKESISPLSQALQSGLGPAAISSLLDCLAIVTFVGATGFEDTERSMQIILNFIRTRTDCLVLKTAISSWGFLLATMESWNINSKLWKGTICDLAHELENDDISVRVAVGETLGLIFEIGDISKFYAENERYTSIDGLKETILKHVKDLKQMKNLSVEVEDNQDSTERVLVKRHLALFHDVLRFLTGHKCPESSVKIGKKLLQVSTWSQMTQLNYLKNFLGRGFLKHAVDNEMLHDFLDIEQTGKQLEEDEAYLSNDEKASLRYVFKPDLTNMDQRAEKRMYKSPNSIMNKANTQCLTEQRRHTLAKHVGHYAVTLGNED